MTAPGYPPPYGAPQGFPAPTYPAPAPSNGARDAVFSALLLLPIALIAVIRPLPWFVPMLGELPGNAWYLGTNAAIDIYFVCLVLIRARTSGRRIGAGAVVVAVAMLDFIAMLWILTLDYWPLAGQPALTDVLSKVIDIMVIMGTVAAWGIARRRHPLWTLGLVPTLIFALAARLPDFGIYESVPGFAGTLVSSAIWYAAPILGALCCWGCDALGSGMRKGDPVGQ